MNRTLRRPMFRMGGSAEGITSGLQPRQGYQGTDNPSDQRVQPPRDRGLSDFLINMGLDLVSRPASGNIFQQVGTSAKEPFKQFQAARAAGEERDYERKLYDQKFDFEKEKFAYEKERDIDDRNLQKYLGELEAKGEKEFIEEQIDAYWDSELAVVPPAERGKIEEKRRRDKYNVIVLGEDISDKYKILSNENAYLQAYSSAEAELKKLINPKTNVAWVETDVGYNQVLQTLLNKYLRLATKFLDPEKMASGGRVGLQMGGDVAGGIPTAMPQAPGSMDQGETNEINISYEQLRERLPQEISNEIVLLLSQSYEAFADFAEIQTQADVNEFNTKYNVQLFLPKQAGA